MSEWPPASSDEDPEPERRPRADTWVGLPLQPPGELSATPQTAPTPTSVAEAAWTDRPVLPEAKCAEAETTPPELPPITSLPHPGPSTSTAPDAPASSSAGGRDGDARHARSAAAVPVKVTSPPDQVSDFRMTRALRRHPWAAVTPMIVLVVAAVAVAVARPAQHETEARLLVGTLDVKAQAVPSYVTATQQLAESYSRLGATSAVLGPAATALRTTPARLRHDLTVSSLPDNPIVRVMAHNSSKRTALAEANAVAGSLADYVGSLANSYASATSIVTNYQSAVNRFERWSVRRDGLKDTLSQLRAPGSSLSHSLTRAQRQTALTKTTAELVSVSEKADNAELVMNGNAAAYNARLQDQRQPQTLTSLGTAASTGTDRTTFLAQAVIAALIIGAVLGMAYAAKRERHSHDPQP